MRFPRRVQARVLAHIQDEIEASGDRSLVLGGAYQQLSTEQLILPDARLAREIELRGEHPAALRLYLDVEVARAPRIVARHDGAEAEAPVRVGELVGAQAEAGIVVVALGVGVPQVE